MIKNILKILIFILVFYSCKKKKLSNLPFVIDKNVTCDVLYKNGYKWSPGVDVTLLGKKSQDTVIYYEVHQEIIFNEEEYFEEEVEIDTVKRNEKHEQYLSQDPLVLSDSIYNLVWGNIKEQQNTICKKSKVTWRNYILKINKEVIKSFKNKIDTSNFRVLNLKEFNYNVENSYDVIEEFKVLNKVKKDTFDCSIYKLDNEYYFSSKISLNI
ncbi:hypothetical protein [Tenacibaculum sp.]|uniref:hypothetical protein n=1 Tax=Tenacibaculum sp. TaxID=1906242 RepID=UPI003D12FAAD